MKLMFNLFILIVVFILNAKKVYAYLDPGSGSFILQIIIGAILGGLVTIKIYFHKIKSFFIKLFHRQNKNTNHKKND
jgi:hypothetical protein